LPKEENGFWLIASLIGILFLGSTTPGVKGGADFLAFYSGAKLAGSGHLYDPVATRALQVQVSGSYGPSLLFLRFPCFGLLLKPLSWFSYETARTLWLGLEILAGIGAVWWWPFSRRQALVVTSWSVPLFACLLDRTDTVLVLLWLSLWLKLEKEGRQFGAGLALAMCIAKFHLFLFLPLVLLRYRRWRTLQGAAAGCAVLMGLSFLAGGWNWPAEYFHMLRSDTIQPAIEYMPNLHGWLPSSWQIPASILVALLAMYGIWALGEVRAVVVALVSGLLLSYHAYVMDGVVLIPAVLLILETEKDWILRSSSFVLASPLFWFWAVAPRQ
jgi:hypothetical protein